MRICRTFIALALFTIAATGLQAAPASVSTDAGKQLLDSLATGEALFFDLDPAFGSVSKRGIVPASGAIKSVLTSSGGYTLRLNGTGKGGILKLSFSLKRADGRRFTVTSYGMAVDEAAIPALKKQEFYPKGTTRTSGNRNPPVICLNNDDGNSELILGFANQIEPAEIRHEDMWMKMARPFGWEHITTKELKDGIYVDVSKQYWFGALRGYARNADQYRHFKPRPIPAQAYEPVWCSWYTLVAGVNQQNIWENAKIAKSLGFGTILIDAGWDTPGMGVMEADSVYGDRVAYRGKFPDMAGLVDRVHKELGMAVELWASPWSIGFKSRANKEINDYRIYLGGNPIFFLCPRCEESGDFLARNISDAFKTYNLDGMWMDFVDSIPMVACKGAHKHDYDTHGGGYTANMTKIMDAIRQANPNALIEFRLNHSNINNKQFANILETNDTPLNFQSNRDMLVYVRTFVDGCVPKTDPTMWLRSRDEGKTTPSIDLVGRFMATMVSVGVPSVSQDFTKIPESNKQVVKAYLDFYHAHKMDMMKGDFWPVGSGPEYPNYVVQGQKATYLYSATPVMPKVVLRKAPDAVFIFNACDKPGIRFDISGLKPGDYEWVSKDPLLQQIGKGSIKIEANGFVWDAPAPVGGMVELRAIGKA